MTFVEWLKSKGIYSYKQYCTCGCYAWGDPNNPQHKGWCAQFEEVDQLYFEYQMRECK